MRIGAELALTRDLAAGIVGREGGGWLPTQGGGSAQ
jgi:hypothetical protein